MLMLSRLPAAGPGRFTSAVVTPEVIALGKNRPCHRAVAPCQRTKRSLLLLLCLNMLLSACGKPAGHLVRLSGELSLIRPGGKSSEWSHADVRVYDKKAFDAVLLDVKKRAEERKRSILDAALEGRAGLQEEMRLCQMNKEQMTRAKELTFTMLSKNLDTCADELRKEMASFSSQIDAIDAKIVTDQKALDDIANKERNAQRMVSREQLMRTVLSALPKPLQEIKSDAHGKFQALVKRENEYIVVTNATGEVAGDIEFYRTSPSPEGQVPATILLSLYNWQ